MNPQGTTALVSCGSRVIAAAIALRPTADGTDIRIDCVGDARSAQPVAGTIQKPARPETTADPAATVAVPTGGDAASSTGVHGEAAI